MACPDEIGPKLGLSGQNCSAGRQSGDADGHGEAPYSNVAADSRVHLFNQYHTMTSSRTVYSGRTRKVVLAFDVGTTFSGISYRYGKPALLYHISLIGTRNSILDPGQSPGIKAVTSHIFCFPESHHTIFMSVNRCVD